LINKDSPGYHQKHLTVVKGRRRVHFSFPFSMFVVMQITKKWEIIQMVL